MLCGGGDVPVDTEWLFKSFPRIFSSSDIVFVLSALEVFATEEDVNTEDDASEDKFPSTGDVDFNDASFACKAVIVVSEFSTRESLSGAIASENHKFAL